MAHLFRLHLPGRLGIGLDVVHESTLVRCAAVLTSDVLTITGLLSAVGAG
ncbi:hypothetical protein PA05_1324 [Cutibacterium acnes P05]|nr:hypothetical protein HMPREF9206_1283 [Cutibacterium acnes J139]MCW5113983.1 hypothetical protein [Cutibacterium acnes P05]